MRRRADSSAPPFSVDDCPRWEPGEYDDSGLPGRIERMRDAHPGNRMIPHLARCAREFHCFAAKNFFARRWEMGLPIAPLCNADCRGCISLQTDDLFPASHQRIEIVPTPEELCEIALPHLDGAEMAVASFGQGCEGEPLLHAGVVERACRLIRERTGSGTLHMNTNGSRPEWMGRLAAAGLESIRISTNSVTPEWHRAYYRPETYDFTDVEDCVKAAVDAGLYTQINYLVFPGVTDLEAEVEAMLDFAATDGPARDPDEKPLHRPGALSRHPARPSKTWARRWAWCGRWKSTAEELPDVAIRYFNRPREEWHIDPEGSKAGAAR